MKLKVLVLPALLILAVNVIRFTGLSVAPPGVHTDESIDSVEIQCLATEGVNASGIRYPFFSVMNHITKPPNYLYPGIVWVKVFGASAESLRAFSAFFIVTAVIGLFFLGGGALWDRVWCVARPCGESVAMDVAGFPCGVRFAGIGAVPGLGALFSLQVEQVA